MGVGKRVEELFNRRNTSDRFVKVYPSHVADVNILVNLVKIFDRLGRGFFPLIGAAVVEYLMSSPFIYSDLLNAWVPHKAISSVAPRFFLLRTPR